jgi:Holliday junction resolvase RusA-like endonuclease
VKIIVPLIPPSVNHYKLRTRKGVTFVSREARVFKMALVLSTRHACNDKPMIADAYAVEVVIYQGKGIKGDVDNYAKCVLDGLVDSGLIHSDSAITDLVLRKRRDRENPRTEITVEAL